MQDDKFDIRRSSKSYIDSPEHYIVTHDGTVYLRIVGQEGSYRVMTATSGEDTGDFVAFGYQDLLNKAAIGVAKLIETNPAIRNDFHNRPYVQICECEFISDAYRAAALLFKKLAQQQFDPASANL